MVDLSGPAAEPFFTPPQVRWTPTAWAVAASLLIHSVGVVALYSAQGLSLNAVLPTRDSTLFEASVLPANAPASAKSNEAQAPQSKPRSTQVTPAASAPKTVPPTPVISEPIAPAPTPDSTAIVSNLTEPEPVIAPVANVPQTQPAPILPVMPAMPVGINEPITRPAMPITQLPHTLDPRHMSPQTRLPDETLAAMSQPYSLPNQVSVRYETNYQGIAARSELQWKKIGEVGAQRYEASLITSALGMELRYKSVGLIGIKGLAPLAVEEKRPFKSAVATSIEPSNNRVIISSKEGFLPYDPMGHDLVSLIIQLGIYAQSLPQWSLPGIAQDFTVYRPNGIKRWRLQSQGLDTIQVRGEMRQVVYIRRIASDGQPDYEDQYHFWLDPKHYGFPVKMRQVDSAGKVTDIVMTDWKEQ
jgi:hypothetical protein